MGGEKKKKKKKKNQHETPQTKHWNPLEVTLLILILNVIDKTHKTNFIFSNCAPVMSVLRHVNCSVILCGNCIFA